MLLGEERTHALLASATQDQGLTHLVDTLQYPQQAELLLKEKVRMERYRTRALLTSATQDQGLTHLVDTIQYAQQAELLLKEKVGMERYKKRHLCG
jgi:hypothetical protein